MDIEPYEQIVISTAIAFTIIDSQLNTRPSLHEAHNHMRLALHAAIKMYQLAKLENAADDAALEEYKNDQTR